MPDDGFSIRAAEWPNDIPSLRLVREQVFVQEQQVPIELEWDAIDPQCRHLLALDANGAPIGTARLLPDGHIGRMAVLKSWRGRGVGSALLRAAVGLARELGFAEVVLNAQVSALPFYSRQGFAAEGKVFMEAGMPHRCMRRRLQ